MPTKLFDLSGKVALVTGGSKGLGKAMARGLAEAGADVFISSRNEDELQSALDTSPYSLHWDYDLLGPLFDQRIGKF